MPTALRARGSSTAPSQHAPTLGAVQAFLGTSAPTSLLIHSSRTQPCPLYLHPTPWHSWRKRADVWKRFPNPQSRGEDLSCKPVQHCIYGLDCKYDYTRTISSLSISIIRHTTQGLQREKSHAVPAQTGAASLQSQALQTEQYVFWKYVWNVISQPILIYCTIHTKKIPYTLLIFYLFFIGSSFQCSQMCRVSFLQLTSFPCQVKWLILLLFDLKIKVLKDNYIHIILNLRSFPQCDSCREC